MYGPRVRVESAAPKSEPRDETTRVDIPATWYNAPARRPSLVLRDELVEGLLDGHAPIVALAAPAGYGKTSAMLQWAEADSRVFAWVQLVEADNDPVHLGRHIALALDAVTPLSERDARLLYGVGRSADLDLFPTLGRILADAPLVLVLDDVHLLTSNEAVRGVEALLAAATTNSQLAIVGRHLPVRLGRHRVGGTVLHLGADELAMDVAEAGELLGFAGLDLEFQHIAALAERTEGWPAGLHLAALAIRSGQPIETFSGRGRLVADYLVEEVLSVLSAETVEFLEQSATLECLDAELLDALLERTDSAKQLAAIESSGNLFLVPLDDERCRYRYHHLFRDLLRERLRTNDQSLAQRLESRASVVLEQAGDVDGAIRHAVKAQEGERAANLILRSTMSRFLDGRVAQLGEWLGLLRADAIEHYPAAAVATAWYGVGRGDRDLAARACAAGERFGWHGPLADGSPSLPVALAMVRVFLGAEGTAGVIRDSEIVREAGGPVWNPWWAMATATQGTAYSMLGELGLARARFNEALADGAGAPYFEASILAHLALLDLHDGDLVEADRLATRARRIADEHSLDSFAPAVSIYGTAALVAAKARRPDEARTAAATARSILVRLGDLSPRSTVFGRLAVAQTALALGDRAEARMLLREAQRARRRDDSATFLNAQLDALAEQLNSAGDLSPLDYQPLTTAELRVLDYLPTHLSLQEIAGELLISRNTAKSHSVAIYRKLGVSSRAEAVTGARELGLLPAP